MRTYETIAGVLIDALLDGKKVLFRPCVDSEKTERTACNMCSTTLEYAYMENRLYAIRCPKCKTVSLIRERCLKNAADYFGYIEEIEEDAQ